MIKLNLLEKTSQGGIFLSPDDIIRTNVFSAVDNTRIFVRGTALDSRGALVQFEQQYIALNKQTDYTFSLSLGYTYLLSVVVSADALPYEDGQIFVTCILSRPFSNGLWSHRALLCHGYISRTSVVSFNGSSSDDNGSEHKYLDALNPADPAAGNNQNPAFPSGIQTEIQAIRITFTTSAAIANRRVFFRIEDSPGNDYDFYAAIDQTSSQTINYVFYPGAPLSTAVNNGYLYIPIPHLFVSLVYSYTLGAVNIQAADQFSATSVFCRHQVIPPG